MRMYISIFKSSNSEEVKIKHFIVFILFFYPSGIHSINKLFRCYIQSTWTLSLVTIFNFVVNEPCFIVCRCILINSVSCHCVLLFLRTPYWRSCTLRLSLRPLTVPRRHTAGLFRGVTWSVLGGKRSLRGIYDVTVAWRKWTLWWFQGMMTALCRRGISRRVYVISGAWWCHVRTYNTQSAFTY